MDLHTQLTKNMEEMVTLFESRMNQFDETLTQSQSQPSSKASTAGIGDLSSLIRDYSIFKELIWKALSMLRHQLQLLSSGFDGHEMLSRRKVLLFHGLPEDKADISQLINDTVCNRMKLVDINSSCIDVIHRLGLKKDKPRPILVRFTALKFKSQVWAAKTTLKGSGITVSEFLTKPRQEAFVAARNHFGMKNCWTSDGFIVIALPDKTRKKIVSLPELQLLTSSFPQTQHSAQEQKAMRTRRGIKHSGK